MAIQSERQCLVNLLTQFLPQNRNKELFLLDQLIDAGSLTVEEMGDCILGGEIGQIYWIA